MHVERNYNSENGVLHECDCSDVKLGSIRIVQIVWRDNGHMETNAYSMSRNTKGAISCAQDIPTFARCVRLLCT